MSVSTPRQRYLYLLSRLYELAAEFTESEIRIMTANFRREDDPISTGAISLIARLHGGTVATAPQREELKAGPDMARGSSYAVRTGDKAIVNPELLSEMFHDRDVFPSLVDIAALFPVEMRPQAKEARERYVRRAVRYVLSLSESELSLFMRDLAAKVPPGRVPFVSRWKSLIEDL